MVGAPSSGKDFLDPPLVSKSLFFSLQEPIPRSCCVLRRFDLDSPPEIENLKQCQMDAKMGVHSSIYIHMRVGSMLGTLYS